jgi:hypothetical protein
LSARGDVSPAQLERVQREIDDLKQTAQQTDLDEMQRARLEGLGRQGKSVLADIAQKQPAIPQESVNATAAALDDIATLGASGPKEIPTPAAASTTPAASPSPSATGSASATTTATASTTPEPTASASPTAEPTSTATGTATPDPSVTSTASPADAESATPAATHAP